MSHPCYNKGPKSDTLTRNRKVENTTAWKRRNNSDLREEYGTTKAPFFVISSGVFECAAAIKTWPLTLELDNRLPSIHLQFGTSDADEVTFFTHTYLCAAINVGNIYLHQWIITTNLEFFTNTFNLMIKIHLTK